MMNGLYGLEDADIRHYRGLLGTRSVFAQAPLPLLHHGAKAGWEGP